MGGYTPLLLASDLIQNFAPKRRRKQLTTAKILPNFLAVIKPLHLIYCPRLFVCVSYLSSIVTLHIAESIRVESSQSLTKRGWVSEVLRSF